MSFSQLSLGYFLKISSLGMILGHLLGQLITFAYLGKRFLKENYESINFERKQMLAIAKRYVNFPKYLLVAHSLNTASKQSPSILLVLLFDTSSAGFYMLTQRVLGAPISVISSAVSDVFRQQASAAYSNRGECVSEFTSTLKKLIFISALPFLIFFIFSKEIFIFVFGDSWATAGDLARILTPMYFFQFISSPMSNMYLVCEKQKVDLYLNAFISIVTAIPFVVAVFFSVSINFVLFMFSISYSIVYVVNLFITYNFSKGTRK